MKKSALLLKWTTIFLSLGIICLILRQANRVYNLFVNSDLNREVFFGIKIPSVMNDTWYLIISIFSILLLLFLIHILNIFRKVTSDLSKNLIFNKTNGIQLARVGKGLLIFGIILMCLTFCLKLGYSPEDFTNQELNTTQFSNYNSGYNFGYAMGVAIGFIFRYLITIGFPIFMGSLFMFIISHLVEKGHYLKNENDLTI